MMPADHDSNCFAAESDYKKNLDEQLNSLENNNNTQNNIKLLLFEKLVDDSSSLYGDILLNIYDE